MSTAAKVRTEKNLHPSRFCSSPACLWRVETRDGPKPCPKHPAPTKRFEVHRHSVIAGPMNGRTIEHSHEGGNTAHSHEHTGPATYTIDKDDWFRATGLCGGGRKQFSAKPSGPQMPRTVLELDTKIVA